MKIVRKNKENNVPLKSVKPGQVLSFVDEGKIHYVIKAFGKAPGTDYKCLLINLENGARWEMPEDEMVTVYPYATLTLGEAGDVEED